MNRNDHGFPELRRQDDLDAEWSDEHRSARFVSGWWIAVAVILTVIGVLFGLAVWVAAGGL